MNAPNDLLSNYQHIIESMALVTGTQGVFDVAADGAVLYSKAQTRRHAEPGEILRLVTDQRAKGLGITHGVAIILGNRVDSCEKVKS